MQKSAKNKKAQLADLKESVFLSWVAEQGRKKRRKVVKPGKPKRRKKSRKARAE